LPFNRRDTASGPYLRTSVRASGRDVDTDYAVVIAAATMMIAMVMIFRISFATS
jgi:hypothetical protein